MPANKRSGMTADDARLILPLVRRVREETAGAGPWDDNGIWAELKRCEGHNLAVTLERFFRHAADPKADSPGSIRRPFLPDAPTSGVPRPPRGDETCPIHPAGHRGSCSFCAADRLAEADDPAPPAPPRTDDNPVDHLRSLVRTATHPTEEPADA